MLAISNEQFQVHVTDETYADLLFRWVVCEIRPNKYLFFKHFNAYNPIRKRHMLMQLVVSGFEDGYFMEAVFEAKARLSHWVKMINVNGIPYPKLMLQNGFFDILNLEVGGKSTCVSSKALGRDSFFNLLVDYHYVSREEIENITKNGIRAFDQWVQIKLS